MPQTDLDKILSLLSDETVTEKIAQSLSAPTFAKETQVTSELIEPAPALKEGVKLTKAHRRFTIPV